MGSDALKQFLRNLEPGLPPANAYVTRPSQVANRVATAVHASAKSRVLLIGQSGVGKTTELSRLVDLVKDELTVVQPPIDALDFRLLDWHDVIVPSSMALGEYKIFATLRDANTNALIGESGIATISIVN